LPIDPVDIDLVDANSIKANPIKDSPMKSADGASNEHEHVEGRDRGDAFSELAEDEGADAGAVDLRRKK